MVSWNGAREFPLEVVKQRFEGSRLKCGDTDGVIAAGQQFCFGSRQAITLVEDQCSGDGVEIQILQNLHDGGNLYVDITGAGIDHMDQQIRLAQFVQGGTKRAKQLLREIADEPDGIGHNHFPVPWKSKSPACRVQSLEYPVLRRDMAFRQHVEQRRFSGVGVPHQRKDRQSVTGTTRTALILMTCEVLKFALQMGDAIPDSASIRFQLRFAGST